MDRGGISNSAEMTTVRLDQASYASTEDITGTVELSNTQRKEVTSVALEFSTWRHIAASHSKRASVEQLSKQTLELFPNAGEHKRYGHDDKILRTNVMFTFTFSGDTKRYPTIEHLENARIKNYITCYVYRKSGLLSRDRLVEKNQFQVPLKFPSLEVDAMFPDRFFNCLMSRPLSSNNAYYEIRARCNTHLMPGLPFLVELDMAVQADISSIVLSLHQATTTSVGAEEEDLGVVSRYVHEVPNPQPVAEGHFRDRDSARRLAHGRRAWLVEWLCPDKNSRVRLPFEQTFYCRTTQGNMERGLSLKVEVELQNAPAKLVAVMHGIQYCPVWTDSRPHQGISLRRARAMFDLNASTPSLGMVGGHDASDRRASNVSGRTTESIGHPYRVVSPINSPQMSVRSGDYFPDMANSPRLRAYAGGAKLSHGSYNPQAVQLLSRSDSLRSTTSSNASRSALGHHLMPVRNVSGKARPEKLSLPPASVRSSMSSAFENLNIRHSNPSSIAANSPTRRDFRTSSPVIHQEPTPPPTQPLPPPPPSTFNNSTYTQGIFDTSSSHSLPYTSGDDRSQSLNKKPPRMSRPAVILGVSQDTIQTREDASRAAEEEEHMQADFGAACHKNAYTANIQRAKLEEGPMSPVATTDRDSGFSDTSFVPGSPTMAGKTLSLTRPVNSSGFARRVTPTNVNTLPRPSGNDAEVMLG